MRALQIALFFIVSFLSCKPQQKKEELKVKVQEKAPKLDSVQKSKKRKKLKYFVNTKNGLNYRETPKGKILGKFENLTEVQIVEHTKIREHIKDGFELLYGEWIGVKKDNKTVYVFSAFITNEHEIKYPKQVGIPIYPVYDYEHRDKQRKIFIPLSETPTLNYKPFSSHPDSLIIPQKYLGENRKEEDVAYFKLTTKYRNRFFAETGIKNTDKIFVYDCGVNKIYIFRVSTIKLVAYLSPYGGVNRKLEQSYYKIGFELPTYMNKQFSIDATFAYIGAKNPFEKGKMKLINWKKIKGKPKKEILEKYFSIKKDSFDLYTFSNNTLRYFLFEANNKSLGNRHITIIDTILNKEVFHRGYGYGEGGSSAPLGEQYTGKLFKDYPDVTFGYTYQSFGCTSIDFIENPRKSITILCDNRH